MDGEHDPGRQDEVKAGRRQRKRWNFAGDNLVDQPEHVVSPHRGEGIAVHKVVEFWPDIAVERPELVPNKEVAGLGACQVICQQRTDDPADPPTLVTTGDCEQTGGNGTVRFVDFVLLDGGDLVDNLEDIEMADEEEDGL